MKEVEALKHLSLYMQTAAPADVVEFVSRLCGERPELAQSLVKALQRRQGAN